VDDLETLLETRRGTSGTANLSAKEFKELLNKITGDKVCIDTNLSAKEFKELLNKITGDKVISRRCA
jgi:hypothetical protein